MNRWLSLISSFGKCLISLMWLHANENNFRNMLCWYWHLGNKNMGRKSILKCVHKSSFLKPSESSFFTFWPVYVLHKFKSIKLYPMVLFNKNDKIMSFSYKYSTETGWFFQETKYLEAILNKLDDDCTQSQLAVNEIYGGIISFLVLKVIVTMKINMINI
jgi:hypothetical protein